MIIKKGVLTLNKYFKDKSVLIQILLFTSTFSIYLNNLSHSVYGSDSGDFLSAAITWGVPHPSGYPLYTILSIIFIKLPFGPTIAWKVGLISVILSSLSLLVFYKISYKFTKSSAISLISSYILAFSYPFWINAEVVEIFSLHNFFLLLLIYSTYEFMDTKNLRWLYFLSFLGGLALTNNLSIIISYPIIIIFILITLVKTKKFLDISEVSKTFLLFFAGLIPYIYIPLAARYQPYINWGNAVNLKNFLHLVLRTDYGWSGLNRNATLDVLGSLKLFINYWKTFIPYSLPIMSLIGITYVLIKKLNRPMFILLLGMLYGPIYAVYSKITGVSYNDIAIQERFFLTSVIIFFLFIPVGINASIKIVAILVKRQNLNRALIILTMLCFALFPLSNYIVNKQKTNFKRVYTHDILAKDILATLPPNSYLFLLSDTFSFPVFYYRTAYGYRKDIIMPLSNTGYKNFIQESNIININEVEQYLIQNRNSLKPDLVQKGIVRLLEIGKPVFIEDNITFSTPQDRIISIPHGLVYQLVFEKNAPTLETFQIDYLPIFLQLNVKQFILGENKLQISENVHLTNVQLRYSKSFMDASIFIKNKYNNNTNLSKFFNEVSQAVYPDIILLKEYQ